MASLCIALYTLPLTPQLSRADVEVLSGSPRFVAAIVAGFAIAIAVQLLLTSLSLALGITAFSGLDEQAKPESSDGEPVGTSPDQSAVRKLNHVFGAWAMMSGSVALFFGAWCGAEISLSVRSTTGVVIGLAIWSLFFIAMLLIEASLVGSLIRFVGRGFSNAAQGLSSVIGGNSGQSESGHAALTAAQVAMTVRSELNNKRESKSTLEKLSKLIDRLPDDVELGELGSDAAGQIEEYRERMSTYFSEVDLSAFDESDREELEFEFSELLGDDSAADWAALEGLLTEDVREELVSTLTERELDSDDAKAMVSSLEDLLDQSVDSTPTSEGDRTPQFEPSDARQELQREFEQLLDDSEVEASTLVDRLKSFDREQFKTVIDQAKTQVSDAGEQLLDMLEDARDAALRRAEELRDEVDRRMEALKQKSLEAAEATRKTVAIAAWWAFGVATVSGVFAIAGGLAGIWTGVG